MIPNLTAIQRGERDAILDALRADLRAFIGAYIFEELCREWVWAESASRSMMPIKEPVRISRRFGAVDRR
ncbi:MAG: DUF234 domain-containing protein [Chloroflexi bacterium]|nr:DUF234 domain-containing protein [Chloroflexota bacterium]